MRFMKMWVNFVPTACVVVMMMSAAAIGQSAESSKEDSTKAAVHEKHLKPQSTCPVSGDPIDKNQYVDYNGKRIYVCCADCLAAVRKDPEKYIKKLENMGQSVETITDRTKKESKDIKADASIKKMKMPGDTVAKDANAGYWTCTMHPEIHKTESGNCPICGMKLVFKKSDTNTTKLKR